MSEDTLDTDGYPEALAVPSERWIPKPTLSHQLDYPREMKLTAHTAPLDQELEVPYSIPGYLYQFQRSPNLTDWETLHALPGNREPLEFTDTDLPTDKAFYRLEVVPAP